MTRFLRAHVEELRGAHHRGFDLALLVVVGLLLLVGLVMVYSASTPRARELHHDELFFLRGQANRAAIGVILMAGLAYLNPQILARNARRILLVALCLLVLVLIPGVGSERRNARRWLAFGFQPSEFMKVALIVYLADFMTRRHERMRSFGRGLGPPLVALGVAALLIKFEPHLSAIVMLGLVAMCLLFVGGARLHHLAAVAVVLAIVGVVSLVTAPYQMARLERFYDGRLDPSGDEYQIYQATLALGTGGVVGPGFGHSLQKFFFLPDAHTDFIMAIVGEELGFVGTLAVLVLFGILLQRGLSIAWRSSSRFNRLLAFGLTAAVFCQALLNLSVLTQLIPTTGQPLPFLSYGGSNLMMTLAEMGILLSLSRHVGTIPSPEDMTPRALVLPDGPAMPDAEFLMP
jgi:cell division protein FtsW